MVLSKEEKKLTFIENIKEKAKKDIKTITNVTVIAPINAKKPTLSKPPILVHPKTMDNTAPNPAPDDMPSKYGSAKGLRMTACMTEPVIPSPAPINKERINLGNLK